MKSDRTDLLPVEEIATFQLAVFLMKKELSQFSTAWILLTPSCLEPPFPLADLLQPFKDEAQTALFKDPVRTAQ